MAQGLARPGIPNPAGQFFTINVHVEQTGGAFAVREGATSRPDVLPGLNPNFPQFRFRFNRDLITPGGTVIPAGTNLAGLFQFAGSRRTRSGATITTLTWLVGGAVPSGTRRLTMIAKVLDRDFSRVLSSDQVTVRILPNISGGQLTPDPAPIA